MKNLLITCILFFALISCDSAKQEAEEKPIKAITTFSGKLIKPSPMEGSPQEEAYLQALENWQQDKSEENYIWLGRRKAYMQHYHEAIAIFTEGIEKFPDSYRLYRHRGHRYISSRQLDSAIADFQQAEQLIAGRELEIEPDGIPNKINTPLSNTHFNIYYHWALAHYLKGEFEQAANLYLKCMQWSVNDDLRVATTDWLYMTYRRLGEQETADNLLESISSDLTIIENESYLKRIQLYKGELKPDALLKLDTKADDFALNLATQGYGVGNWFLYKGDDAMAKAIFKKVLAGEHWAAFGYIAAEADLNRLENE